MSPLGTESTQCCSRHANVKYCLEVILHIGFGVVGISNGRLATADAFADRRNVLQVSLILVLLTTAVAAALTWTRVSPC